MDLVKGLADLQKAADDLMAKRDKAEKARAALVALDKDVETAQATLDTYKTQLRGAIDTIVPPADARTRQG
jgi:multidrug efflux pump subunit AcrA (membrane-fusion protein)